MTVNIYTLFGRIQTGKTMIAIGALREAASRGIAGCYILPTQQWACDAQKRFSFQPPIHVTYWRTVLQDGVGLPVDARIVVIEDSRQMPEFSEGLQNIKNRLALHKGPTQIIVIRGWEQ